jgi:hypothetical protein
MALIKCAECHKEVSDQALACPNCGAPSAKATRPAVTNPTTAKRRTHPVTWVVLAAIVVAGTWYTLQQQRVASLPPLPVKVQFRPALTGPGLVLMVTNDSNRYLSLAATLTNPSLHREQTFRLDAAPHREVSVGHHEGWTLSSGDQITIANNDYQPWKGSIP